METEIIESLEYENIEALVSWEPELKELMEEHDFLSIRVDAKQIIQEGGSIGRDFIENLTDRMRSLSKDIRILAEKKNIPYHVYSAGEMSRFWKESKKRSKSERAYNYVGDIIHVVILELDSTGWGC